MIRYFPRKKNQNLFHISSFFSRHIHIDITYILFMYFYNIHCMENFFHSYSCFLQSVYKIFFFFSTVCCSSLQPRKKKKLAQIKALYIAQFIIFYCRHGDPSHPYNYSNFFMRFFYNYTLYYRITIFIFIKIFMCKFYLI